MSIISSKDFSILAALLIIFEIVALFGNLIDLVSPFTSGTSAWVASSISDRSIIVNEGLKPSLWASCLSTYWAREWKVPPETSLHRLSDNAAALSSISLAAFLVKVRRRISFGGTLFSINQATL